jgi:DNA polymerase III epsilon subunit family exonuclease
VQQASVTINPGAEASLGTIRAIAPRQGAGEVRPPLAPDAPSPSQLRAIEAEPGPVLVLAGPGSGKTLCLIRRIQFLIDQRGFDPARICAFTFTNKAAGEIAERLAATLGAGAASQITRGTIHAFCAQLLREFGTDVGVQPGFGIADEDYQISLLRRVEGPRPRAWHRSALTRFSAHRFRHTPLKHEDVVLFDGYERLLAQRKVLDFDLLVMKAAALLELPGTADEVRRRWDVILVDEFQDLNPVQYRIVRSLAHAHHEVFAVGDDEQSIYSWAGADIKHVFPQFMRDFGIAAPIHLDENYRCPRDVVTLARRLVTVNEPLFAERQVPRAEREPTYPVVALTFESDDDEAEWIVRDIRSGRESNSHPWGSVALLYRTHEIGEQLEIALLNAGIPCRLAQGRALAEDAVIGYVIAAARAIAYPRDDVARDEFFRAVLPKGICDEAAARAERGHVTLWDQILDLARQVPAADGRARQIRRAHANWRNLVALGKHHATIATLVHDLLSRKVGRAPSVLDERHDQISDPAENDEVVRLTTRLRAARARGKEVWIAPMNGVDIPLKGMLAEIGITAVRGAVPPSKAERLESEDVPSLGIALGVFKAAQLIEMSHPAAAFTDFTAIDLETTDRDVTTADIVEVAAVRVRGGEIVDTFSSLVKPRRPISPEATAKAHGLTDADVAAAQPFEQVWPTLREFCGHDVLVAHNGYKFDFQILPRMVRELGEAFTSVTYDSLPVARELFPTSGQLPNLARHLGIELEHAHRALDDTVALAKVFLALDEKKLQRARKTALISLLDHLGVALALSDQSGLCDEATLFFREITPAFSLGRYSRCLDWYEHEQGDDASIPSVEEVIDAFSKPDISGAELMVQIRRERTAAQRYPAALNRLRRLIARIPDAPLGDQLSLFLERCALSKLDGDEHDPQRVNLLTLHSTKGLEFSRVYVMGAEDAQFLLGTPPTVEEIEEARRLLYVGMTRARDRLVLTRVESRGGKTTGGHRFLDEMELRPVHP